MRKSLRFTCGGNDLLSFGILTRERSTIVFLAVLPAEPDSYKTSAAEKWRCGLSNCRFLEE
jgi:hypothetical protein